MEQDIRAAHNPDVSQTPAAVNDRRISMYSFGMTSRNIKALPENIYNVDVSPEPIAATYCNAA
ncbi:MAG: hypothetical protein LBB61_04225 [Treponema sp.]|nr:hypothetical protein [Treponema sp.]